MSFLDLATKDIPDLSAAEQGEAELELVSWGMVEEGVAQSSGRAWKRVNSMHRVIGRPNTKLIRYTHWLPVESDSEEQKTAKLRSHKYFRQAHGFDLDGPLDPESTIGSRAWAFLVVEHDDQFGDSNRVQRWMTSQA